MKGVLASLVFLTNVLPSGCVVVDPAAGDTATLSDTSAPPVEGTATGVSLPAGFRARVDGVRFVPPTCDPAAADDCDGRDDDCDGRIDDGCGLTGGDGVQVVLGQDVEADFALSVESPIGGHRLNRSTEDVEYGGRFERPREESCGFDEPSDYVQSAFWAAPDAPAGTYRVDFSVYGGCDAFPGDIDLEAEVGIAIGGSWIGAFRFPYRRDAFASTDLVPILEFDVE
jgi:hypothetical protein